MKFTYTLLGYKNGQGRHSELDCQVCNRVAISKKEGRPKKATKNHGRVTAESTLSPEADKDLQTGQLHSTYQAR